MTDTRYLVHGVFWDGPPAASGRSDGGSPVLRLQQLSPGHGFSELRLHAGARLGFRVADGAKHCLGHTRVFSASEREHVPCPDRFPAARGSQCEPCFVVDDSRLIHDFHRGGRVPPGLRNYLMQPHWLYVATFAHGASKIGTASQPRKWNRLAEQGAVVARYVALAEDGRVVRLLEDMVTREAGLAQQVRSAAKTAALTDPRRGDELDELNRRLAEKVRSLLAGTAVGGFETVDEQWVRPGQAAGLCQATPRHAYPHDMDGGSHGFTLGALCGSHGLAAIDGSGLDFVVNLGLLKARLIEPGEFSSEVPAVQEALF
ncbi:hypothetical protein J2809_000240 [Arthrobacter pascens]|uniref:DUF2797 domain-containing protein n=1 Tax=Arthrobacter pascens TaxID=1677 RepID=UPI00285FA21E|nr:DUF2797 domain-containing protein [Arthrobacter pascens]MDR6555909.1 hypothetical protein [Arthrobacter pascens]